MKIGKIFMTALLASSITAAYSQNRLSLQESIHLAVERNINVVSSRIEQEKSVLKIAEVASSLLPQVNGSASFMDNLELPTTILPGEIIGAPGTTLPVKMGVQFNTSMAVTVNQVLFDQTRFTALKLTKQAEEISRLSVEKAGESIAMEVAKLYFLIQTTGEQASLIEGNISRTERMAGIIKLLRDSGMGKQVDYDRIMVSLQNLQTQLDNTNALYEQQINLLKYMLQIPDETEIELTESITNPLVNSMLEMNTDFSQHIDIQLLEMQKDLTNLNRKNINNGYLPTLTFVGQYAYQGQRKAFKNYFNDNPENNWYGSSYVGLNLSIPIFDGFNKRSKSRQADSDYTQSKIRLKDTEQRLNIDYKNGVNNYRNTQNNVSRQKQNIELAEKVYRETELKYREGQASLNDLLQDEMGLSNAQSGYLNALYGFKEAELNIMSLNGEIKKYISK